MNPKSKPIIEKKVKNVIINGIKYFIGVEVSPSCDRIPYIGIPVFEGVEQGKSQNPKRVFLAMNEDRVAYSENMGEVHDVQCAACQFCEDKKGLQNDIKTFTIGNITQRGK